MQYAHFPELIPSPFEEYLFDDLYLLNASNHFGVALKMRENKPAMNPIPKLKWIVIMALNTTGRNFSSVFMATLIDSIAIAVT